MSESEEAVGSLWSHDEELSCKYEDKWKSLLKTYLSTQCSKWQHEMELLRFDYLQDNCPCL